MKKDIENKKVDCFFVNATVRQCDHISFLFVDQVRDMILLFLKKHIFKKYDLKDIGSHSFKHGFTNQVCLQNMVFVSEKHKLSIDVICM